MKNSTVLSGVVCTLALAWTSLGSAGINSWTAEGPVGGPAHVVAVHPTLPNILLRSTSLGLFRSTDSGHTWTRVREGFSTNVVFDPLHPGRVYLGSGPLQRSDDSGLTFSELPVAAGRPYSVQIAANGTLYGQGDNFALSRSGDEGQTWTVLPRPWPTNVALSTITLDPNDANVLYVTVNDVGTFRSADRGQTWSMPASGSPGTNVGVQPPNSVWSFVVQPGNSNRLIAGTSRGIRISHDAGATWADAAAFRFAYWIAYHPANAQRAIALSLTNQVMRSEDGGLTWPTSQDGADPRKFTYVQGALDRTVPGRFWIASGDGVAVSPDWGATFDARDGDLRHGGVTRFAADSNGTVFAAFQSPIGLFRRSGTNWTPLDISTIFTGWSNGFSFRDFTIAPSDRNVFYAANIDRVFGRSMDAGTSWHVMAANFPAANIQAEKIIVSPVDARIVYVACGNNGLWRSTNSGITWTHVAGLPNNVNTLTIDPADPDVMYVSAGSFLPDTILRSTDGGSTWDPLGTVTDAIPSSIVIDPSDSNVLYATSNSWLNKSVNGGATWTRINMEPPPGSTMNASLLLIDPVITTTIFAAAAPSIHGIARSVDGGATWETLSATSPPSNLDVVYQAILDPVRPSRVIANPQFRGLMTFEVAPDLALSLSGFGGPLPVGASANATVTVRNLGPYASSGSEVRITLPAWVTPTVPSNCTLAANTLTCSVGVIRVNQEAQIPLTLAVAATPDTGAVSAIVEGHEVDAATVNNSRVLNLTSTVQNAFELHFASPTIVAEHDARVTFTVTGRNLGPSPAQEVPIALQLGGFEFVATNNASGGTCSMNTTTNTMTCTYQRIAAGAEVSFTVRADARTIGAHVVTATMNGAVASAQALTNVTVRPVADFSLELTGGPSAPVTVGTGHTYTMTVRNNGPDAGEVSANAEFDLATITGVTATNITCSRSTVLVNCLTNSLASGGVATVDITLTAGAPGIAHVNARATAAAVVVDHVPANDIATSTANYVLVGDAGVEIADSADPLVSGVPFSYLATVRNAGPNAGAVHLAVPVTGATVTGVVAPPGGTCTNTATSADCDFASLASGVSATVTINVTTTAAGTASAAATVTFAGTDPAANNNTANASTTINSPPPPSSSSSGGGGGGGGSFDWLAAALLGLLLARRSFGAAMQGQRLLHRAFSTTHR